MKGFAVAGAAVVAAALSRPAFAGPNDLVLSRLGTCVAGGAATADCANATDVIGSNIDFRSLSSELGVVLAPRLLTPADTLGFGGFQFTVDFQTTRIANDAPYWRVLEGSPNPGGAGVHHGDAYLPTVGFFARKGLWMPLPSFEVGAGAVHLLDSNMWAAQAYGKLALHEGYHDFPLPSAAIRGGVSRVMGTDQIDLTIASLDVTLSKDFGYQGTVGVSPYGGWNLLWIVPRSEVIDKTPGIDVRDVPQDIDRNFAFKDQANITRHRLFAGLKLQYYVFEMTLEAAFALAGSSVDDRAGTDVDCADVDPTAPTTRCDATDQAAAQQSYTLSIGLDF
ncbi:MAG: hypothetical protein D6689_02000 [Deltaproteobacteria bacterium]|nr:MAG: hypothetical protein D6689_02000 [Deltaproteobacteria bacterium]